MNAPHSNWCFVLLLYLGVLLCNFSLALKCFLCNVVTLADLPNCPQTGAAAKIWSADNTKYQSIGPETDISCAIGYSVDSGKIYIQSGVPKASCSTTDYQNILIIKIAKLGDTGAAVTCCSKDGCNWNASTAQNNQDYGDITSTFFFIPDIVNWTPIIIGASIGGLVFICLIAICCYFICCALCFKLTLKKKPTKKMAPYSDPAHKGNQKYPPQPTPTRQIGVEPNGQPRNYQNPNLARKPELAKEPPNNVNIKKAEEIKQELNKKGEAPKIDKKTNNVGANKKTNNVDPLSDKAKDLFAKEQGDWVQIWKNANDPNYKGPLSKKQSKYEKK